MKKIIILIILVNSLFSCNEQKLKKINDFYFSLYNNKNIKVEKNVFILKRRKLNLFDFLRFKMNTF